MIKLALKIYDSVTDMDFADYTDTQTQDIVELVKDLELLENQGNNSLLNAIKMLLENQ